MDYDKGLARAMRHCSTREVAAADMVALLTRWGVTDNNSEAIIARLIKDRFIDDERYARAYVNDKIRFGKWGRRKIEAALIAKRIDKGVIGRVISELIEPEDMARKVFEEIKKKSLTVKSRDRYELKGKLMRFALSRGFEMEESLKAVNAVCNTEEE